MRLAQGTDWIKPRYNEYLKGNRDAQLEKMYAGMLLDIPERDRTRSWSASGAGTCLRARQFAFMGLPGTPPDEHALNIFLNGHWVHMRHQVVGLVASYLRHVEVPLSLEAHRMRGTADAIDMTDSVVEYKSINMNGYMQVRQFGPKEDHKQQVHAYMLAGEYKQARIIYENKNTNDIVEFLVPRDPDYIDRVKDDLNSLNTAQDKEVLLPIKPECMKKEGAYRWCPFASRCLKIRDFREALEKSATPVTSSSDSD